MSFRCTSCTDKSYDKAWKLQRQLRESSKCFEQLNPGTSATRFKCTSCDYTSPREEVLKRHRRLIHLDIIGIATCTEDAGQYVLESNQSLNIAHCLPPATLLDTTEHSDDIKRIDQHHGPVFVTGATKRKDPDLEEVSLEQKRVCIETIPLDLDALSLVDASDTREDHREQGCAFSCHLATDSGRNHCTSCLY
jgi:hypothetical protein